jgi:tetratricopeptide (TPR) repeat protein
LSGEKASKIVQRARELAGQGEVDRAIAECRQAAAHLPDEPEISLCLGELFLKNQLMPEATEAYDQAARLFLQEESVVKAVCCYKEILKIQPTRADICVSLGDANARRGQVHNAVADYLAGAKIYIQNGAAKETCNVYRKILALVPHNTGVRLRLAELHLQHGETKEGVKEYLGLADEYERLQREPEARTLYEAILKHSPGHREASRRLGLPIAGEPERQLGGIERERALDGIDQADREDADHPRLVSHSANGNSDDEIVLKDVPGVETSISQPQALDTFVVEEASFPDEEVLAAAERDFSSPISSELEEELEAQYELALAYKEMGLLDEAIETFEQVLRGPSRFLDACTMIAMCYKERRLNKAAIEWLERAGRHPRCEGAVALSVKLALAQLYEAEGQGEKAAQLYGCLPAIQQTTERGTPPGSASRNAEGASRDSAADSKLEKPEKPRRISFF